MGHVRKSFMCPLTYLQSIGIRDKNRAMYFYAQVKGLCGTIFSRGKVGGIRFRLDRMA